MKRGSLLLQAVALLSCGLTMAVPAMAGTGPGRPGTLDPSFGQGGRSVLRLGPAIAESSFDRVFLQTDGKIVVVGRFQTQARASTVIERRLPDGKLDDTFGKGGEVVLPAYVVGQESDGRLLIIGGKSRPGCADETLRRLSFDGTEDGSFGSNGCSAEIPFSVEQAVTTSDGHIYLLGAHGYGPATKAMPQSEEIGLARLAADGGLDQSFGKGGVLFTHTGAGLELSRLIGGTPFFPLELSGMAPMPDGGVVVSARAVIGFTATGALDSGFGSGGIVEVAGSAEDLLPLPDGRLVVASSCCGPEGFHLTRLLPEGKPDPTFGAGGTSTVDDGASNASVQIAGLPDGRLMLVSSGVSHSCAHRCPRVPTLARLNPDGSLDRGYGEDGVAGLGPSRCAGDDLSHPGLAVQADGRAIVAAGTAASGDACLTARAGSGHLDRGFGREGYVVQRYLEPSDTEVDGFAIEPTGRMVITATGNVGKHDGRPILLDARPNGVLDRKLGSAAGFRPNPARGEVRSGGDHRLFSIVRAHSSFEVVEFDDRGRLARRYGSRGKASLPSGFQPTFFLARPDGRVLVFGLSEGHRGMAVFRLDAHGHPDRGFGRDGLEIVGFGSEARVRSAIVEPGGRIVIAGSVGHVAAAVRLLPDGRPDPAFGHRGRALHLLGLNTVATTVARRGSGIVLGCMHIEGHGRAPGSILVGLDGSGRRDPSFGHRGVNRLGGQAAPLALFGGDRRIVLLTSRGAFGFDGLLARAFGPRGAVDRSFGSRGTTVVAPARRSDFRPLAATRQSDGRIVVAGETSHESTVEQVELVRLR